MEGGVVIAWLTVIDLGLFIKVLVFKGRGSRGGKGVVGKNVGILGGKMKRYLIGLF